MKSAFQGHLAILLLAAAHSLSPLPTHAAELPKTAPNGKPWNILLIILDDLNDYPSGFANYPGVKTPNFDKLAASGMRFPRAVCPGTMLLRTPAGIQKLKKGDVVFFEKGPTGAHQLYNPGPRPCVYLDLRTTPGFDICDYPDSGKLLVAPDGGIYRKKSAVGYFDGEENPWAHWLAARKTKEGKKR